MGYVEPPELRFDLRAWSQRISLAGEREIARRQCHERWEASESLRAGGDLEGYVQRNAPTVDVITGPRNVIVREGLLAEQPAMRRGAPRAVDLFVWTCGEPPVREASKLGGLPYWPASEAWPTVDGRAAQFVAQLLVTPSRDLFADALGDVMCVFASPDERSWLGDGLFVRWVDMSRAPLVAELPVPSPWPSCWGQRHRTLDYPASRLDGVVHATKIGGAPVPIQPDADLPEEIFRGALGPVYIAPGARWGVCDVPSWPRSTPSPGCTWGDMGSVAILAPGDGSIELDSTVF